MSKRAIPFSIIRDWSMPFCAIADICGFHRNFIFMFWPGTFCSRAESAIANCAITWRRCSKLYRAHQYISDMLIALTRATPEQAFLLRAHVGNYSLFISGIFHEHTQRRSLRGGPDIKFYEQIGRTNFEMVASHATARHCELDDVFEELADRFREVRIALNHLSDQLLNLDDDARPSRSL